jgi:hypothetical protein
VSADLTAASINAYMIRARVVTAALAVVRVFVGKRADGFSFKIDLAPEFAFSANFSCKVDFCADFKLRLCRIFTERERLK